MRTTLGGRQVRRIHIENATKEEADAIANALDDEETRAVVETLGRVIAPLRQSIVRRLVADLERAIQTMPAETPD